MSITIEVTERIARAAKFSKQTVSEFAEDWIAAGVEACEDDYITHAGEIIGDRRELENSCDKF
jgi:hypothetical protein